MVLPSCGSISRIHIGPHVEMVWGADSWHPLLGDWFSGSELNSQSIFLTNAQMILMRQFRLVWNIYSYRLLNFFASQKYDSFFLSGFVFFFFFFGGGSVETFNIYKQEESTISPFKVLTSFKANNYLPFCFSVSFLRKPFNFNWILLKSATASAAILFALKTNVSEIHPWLTWEKYDRDVGGCVFSVFDLKTGKSG